MRTCMTTLAPEWSDQEKKVRVARGLGLPEWRTLNLVLRRDAMQFAFWASHRNLLWNEKLGKIFFLFFKYNFTISQFLYQFSIFFQVYLVIFHQLVITTSSGRQFWIKSHILAYICKIVRHLLCVNFFFLQYWPKQRALIMKNHHGMNRS